MEPKLDKDSVQQQIRDAIEQYEGRPFTSRDIINLTGAKAINVQGYICQLSRVGILDRIEKEKNGYKYVKKNGWKVIGEYKPMKIKNPEVHEAAKPVIEEAPAPAPPVGRLTPLQIGEGIVALVAHLKSNCSTKEKHLIYEVESLKRQLITKENDIRKLKQDIQDLKDEIVLKNRKLAEDIAVIKKVNGSSGISLEDLVTSVRA